MIQIVKSLLGSSDIEFYNELQQILSDDNKNILSNDEKDVFKYLEKEKSKKNYDTFTISCLLVIIYTTSNLEFEKIIKDPFFNDFINRDLFRMMQLRSSIQYNIQLPNTYLFKE